MGFCGIDWAEDHHDVAVVDTAGTVLGKRRIPESVEGYAELLELLARVGDTAEDPIPVAIETPRGLLVAALRASGRPVYAINPKSVARYRERHTVSNGKSDQADAKTLANILRTDEHEHRQMPADSELAQAISVLARAQQDAVWRRSKAIQELRALLREYYPGLIQAFAGNVRTNLAKPEARALLALAPTPTEGAKLSKSRIAAALRRAGRQRGIDDTAVAIRDALRRDQLHHPELVEQAMGRQAVALLATLNAECDNVDQLAEQAVGAFRQHPDYAIITSFPGLGAQTGARVLGEIGDDRARFADARALKAFAGSAPITRASGRSTVVTHRHVKNMRLAGVGFVWTFATVPRPGPAKEHYQYRRARGDRHAAALRNLFNRFLGQLWHCLQHGQLYDEAKAFPHYHATHDLAAA